MTTYIKNISIYAESGFIKNGSILIDGETIAKIYKDADVSVPSDKVIDGKGNIAIPGYIDSHVHGGNKFDIGDGKLEDIYGTRDFYQKHGVTLIYPTFMTNTLDVIEDGLKNLRIARKTNAPGKAEIAPSHIEGPFLNPAYKGCQAEELIISLDENNIKLFEEYKDVIARVTVAPEYGHNLEFFPQLIKLGIQISVGHSCATSSQVHEAAKQGATSITHLYNAQSSVHKEGPFRICGVVEEGLSNDDLYIEAICDGYHLPNELIKIAYKCKGPDKFIVVSDASLCAGIESGSVVHTDVLDYYIENGIAMNMARTSFASSTTPIDKMVRHLIFEVKLPVEDVVKMSSASIAKLMGIYDKKGSIAEGKDADINIVDAGFNVIQTLCKGE